MSSNTYPEIDSIWLEEDVSLEKALNGKGMYLFQTVSNTAGRWIKFRDTANFSIHKFEYDATTDKLLVSNLFTCRRLNDVELFELQLMMCVSAE